MPACRTRAGDASRVVSPGRFSRWKVPSAKVASDTFEAVTASGGGIMHVRVVGSFARFSRVFVVALLMAVSRGAAGAQDWGRFTTTASVSIGAYQVRDEHGWGLARAIAVRQSVAAYFFVEAEAAWNRAPLVTLCALPMPLGGGAASCPDTRLEASYGTVGIGVQVPIGRARPFLGASRGRVAQRVVASETAFTRITDDSRSSVVGTDLRLRKGLRAHLEYRRRRDEQAGGGTMRADQWLVGMSLRIAPW